jgi:hypothetical protein
MPPADEGAPRYEVHCSGVVAQRLRDLQREASRAGRGEELLAAFRAIVARLQADPHELGEPLFRLPVLRMQVRCVAILPLVLDYAVCEDRPAVFIKSAKALAL